MAARTFEDSTGATWEVFEVHRASDKAGAVSAGLEHGWLAFVNGTEKRRLAPFPRDWALAGEPELARLCAQARQASRSVYERPSAERRALTAEEESRADDAVPADGPTLTESLAAVDGPADETGHADKDAVEALVRDFARDSQRARTPAVAAMVRLKALLAERFPGARHVARNARLVRRWFVESYYFQRDA